jgi:type IV pilus assembly protein PilC
MEYVCRLGTPSGEVVEKTVSATDMESLRADLERQGYYVFSTRAALSGIFHSLRSRRIPQDFVLIFAQELAALLKAGLPVVQSLEVMLERQRHPAFRKSLTSVRDRVKAGTALSDAFVAEGDLYPPMFAASIVAGERSGSLETVLRRFTAHLRISRQLRKKAISASVYPAVLIAAMVGLTSLLLVVIIPQFKSFFEGLGAELPVATLILLAVGTSVQSQIRPILLGLFGIVVVGAWWLRREGSGETVDRVLLRLPIVGSLAKIYATSQLCRTLSMLLAGGLPLVNAIEVAAASVGNRAMGRAVAGTTHLVREGTSLTDALASCGMFEGLPLEMVKVGEQTGALSEMLGSVSDFYDEETETRMATVLSLVEPVLLVLMAIIVAGMVLAFYLPMFQAISAIQRR